MHDPLVVAFQIRRPWPKGRSGRRYRPALVTVWHREPGGHDSGEVCRHHDRYQDASGDWQYRFRNGWRWHVHHWHIQVPPLQDLRRRLLTRCAWCGGRSRKGDAVNFSHSWDGPRGRWWRGEPGLYHQDCSSVARAHRLCFCDDPGLRYGDHGQCVFCGKFRSYRQTPDAADRLLASLSAGSRIPLDRQSELNALWADRRARREAPDA